MQIIWKLIDQSLEEIKVMLSQDRLDSFNASLVRVAGTGIPTAIIVVLLNGLLISVKTEDFNAFATAWYSIVGIIVLGYLSYRCADGCRHAGKNDRAVLTLSLYLDILVIIGLLAFVAGIVAGASELIDGTATQAGLLLIMSFSGLVLAWTSSNQAELGIEVDTSLGASNDLLSLLSAVLRIVLRSTLTISSFVILLGTVMTLIFGLGFVHISGDDLYETQQYVAGVTSSTIVILAGVAAPVAAYLSYVLISFPIGLVENFFAIKGIERNTRAGDWSASAEAPAAPEQVEAERVGFLEQAVDSAEPVADDLANKSEESSLANAATPTDSAPTNEPLEDAEHLSAAELDSPDGVTLPPPRRHFVADYDK